MPVHGLPVVEVDTGTVSKGSTEIQEVVRQGRGVLQDKVVLQAVLQGVRRDCWDCRELWGLQEALGLKTVEVLQMGCQEDRGHQEVWVLVEENLLGPKVGVVEG